MNKRGLSPLVATVLLVVFALILGIITMNFGRSLEVGEGTAEESSYVIGASSVDNELKELQMDYLLGRVTLEEYLSKEQAVLKEMDMGR